MAASIKGRQVVWGISAATKSLANAATTSGIVQSVTINSGGEVTNIGDEENDQVTRIDHAKVNTGTIEVLCEPTTVMPKKGDELTLSGTVDGVDLATGRSFVEDAQAQYQNAQVKKITVPFTHYPEMGSDGG